MSPRSRNFASASVRPSSIRCRAVSGLASKTPCQPMVPPPMFSDWKHSTSQRWLSMLLRKCNAVQWLEEGTNIFYPEQPPMLTRFRESPHFWGMQPTAIVSQGFPKTWRSKQLECQVGAPYFCGRMSSQLPCAANRSQRRTARKEARCRRSL